MGVVCRDELLFWRLGLPGVFLGVLEGVLEVKLLAWHADRLWDVFTRVETDRMEVFELFRTEVSIVLEGRSGPLLPLRSRSACEQAMVLVAALVEYQ